jgi:biopolymer transport protein ExbD
MIRRRKRPHSEVPELPMDSMVDIVFQLLIFFLFTFQVRMLETVLATEIAVPRPPSAQPVEKDDRPPLQLVLQARPDGAIESLTLDGEPVASLEALATALARREADRPAEKRQVALRPAEGVRYDGVVQAARVVAEARWRPQLGTVAAK